MLDEQAVAATPDEVHAGALPAWGVGELPEQPRTGWGEWRRYIGPGILMAGASVAAGEWLFGPAVSGQYGGTVLWLATLSILLQLFLNLECGRWALYCGEPAMVGFFRTKPGPKLWTPVYLTLELHNIWPFMAANSAVPLAAAILGHLPGDAVTSLMGFSLTENGLVRILGYGIFLAAFIPLIFGGAVYRMVEKIMAIKVIIVLVWLSVIVIFMVSGPNLWEATSGLFRFGTVPLRAESVIDGRHFTLTEHNGPQRYTIRGTIEAGRPLITSFTVVGQDRKQQEFTIDQVIPPDLRRRHGELAQKASSLARPGRFLVEHTEDEVTFRAVGSKLPDGSWNPTSFAISEAGEVSTYDRLADVPESHRSRLEALIENRGVEPQNLLVYLLRHGTLPDLDWGLLAAFFAIAGMGGFSNCLYSNYVRDKGWGMGRRVGAIPSAIGGRSISLSHVGKVFRINAGSLSKWRGWMRYITADQTVIWMGACILGVLLPCMISLEFIRNAPVSGERVAAITADGIASVYPAYHGLLWSSMLLCGFLVLGPGQVYAAEAIARRWTDILWVVDPRFRSLQGNQVKYIYYGILGVYGIWGLFALSLVDPLTLAKIGGVLANFALGSTAFHTLYINRKFLPPELRPGRLNQVGILLTGCVAWGISAIGLPQLLA